MSDAEPRFTLEQAIRHLCQVHTRDDAQIGFIVPIGETPDHWHIERYAEAWLVLREHIGLPIGPKSLEGFTREVPR